VPYLTVPKCATCLAEYGAPFFTNVVVALPDQFGAGTPTTLVLRTE
jgi:hypothetical protein